MDDAFATLGLERRLTLDDQAIESAWRELGAALHPDQDQGDAEKAAAVNQAYQALRSPARRLRHWLELHEAGLDRQTAITPDMMALFSEVGAVLNEADEVLKKRAAASSALAKALLAEAEIGAQQKLQALLGRLGREKATALDSFPAFETAASESDFVAARAAAGRLGFLEKWETQVQERLMSLIAG